MYGQGRSHARDYVWGSGSRFHGYCDSTGSCIWKSEIGISYGTDYNEGTIDSSHETHPPKSTPMTEPYTPSLNSPESTSDNPESESTVLHLYKNDAISLGKAGEILGLSKQDMLHRLSIRGIPISYTTDDLESDLKTLDHVLSGPSSQTHHNHATRIKHPLIVPQEEQELLPRKDRR